MDPSKSLRPSSFGRIGHFSTDIDFGEQDIFVSVTGLGMAMLPVGSVLRQYTYSFVMTDGSNPLVKI